MKKKSFFEEVEDILKKDVRFVSENGELLRNAVFEAAQKMDAKLLKALRANEATRKRFFTDVGGGISVFDKQQFGWVVSNRAFLPDSYTRFRNKIGLAVGDDMIASSPNVELVFPYKDCVLEGGQTKDDQRRDEIFYNTTLAPDDVDRLLAPKVLTNAKKYENGKWHAVDSIEDCDSFMLRGNNLLGLSCLLERCRSRVQCIFIDPPFNTGSDGFNYNDSFNHSSWLTFIKNRLVLAKQLLLKSGVICVDIGNEEVHYLRVLLDEVFGAENYLNHITMSTNDPSGFKATGAKIFSTSNHLLIYANDIQACKIKKMYVRKNYDSNYRQVLINPTDEYKKWRFSTVADEICKEKKLTKKEFAMMAKEVQLQMMSSYADAHKDTVFRTAALGGGARIKRIKTIELSAKNKGEVFRHPNDDIDGFYILNGEGMVFWGNLYREIDGDLVPAMPLTDVWTDIKWTGIAGEGGVTLKNGKKPELLIKRILELTTDENDLVLDYHLGSGTTAAVAHKMKRRWIGIEQLDYGDNDSIVRLKKVIDGDKSGISKLVDWKGGGSFVCCELAKSNQKFVERIEAAKKDAQLVKIWNEILATGFISCKLDPAKFSMDDEDFKALALADKKRILMDILDMNQLYVNYCDIDDKTIAVAEADKAFTRSFYGEE